MVASYKDDFTVTWKDPADALMTWVMDAMHFPRPLPPLGANVFASAMEQAFGARVAVVNGFAFLGNYGPPPPTPEVMQRGAFDVWTKDYQPIIERYVQKVRTTDYDAMSMTALAAELPGIMRGSFENFRYTMVVVVGFMMPTMALVDFCEKELGAEGVQLLMNTLQGFENETASAGAGLAGLAETAARLPDVARALREARYGDVGKVPGGAEFMAEFQKYLQEYGWRAESWGLAHVPTWAEQPEVPLMLISRYIADPERSPSVAMKRSVRQREDAEREIRSRLSGEKLGQFEAMLAGAAKHVSISEGRALWQLMLVGTVRVPTLAMGRKLVSAGVIAEPNDVFFLSLEEIAALAANPADRKEMVAGRKADLARQEKMQPPPFIGAPPDPASMPPEVQAIMFRFFGLGPPPAVEPGRVTGQAASKGVVRGVARIIRSLSDAGRLQPGEILVCPMTAPPWTPLFAIAGGVVTDTGGILSHSAICAREYAIPCVVGTTLATHAIPDGAMVTVDGTKGVVTFER